MMLRGARPLTPTNAVGLASRQGFPHQKRPSGNRKPLDVSASHTHTRQEQARTGVSPFPNRCDWRGKPLSLRVHFFPSNKDHVLPTEKETKMALCSFRRTYP